MIEFRCSECGKQLRAKDDAAGKKGKCPQCGAMLVVPNGEMGTIEAAQPLRATPAPPPGAEERANTTAPEIKQKPGPRGIGGWLMIPAIGLVLGPIRSTTDLYRALTMIQIFAPEMTDDPYFVLTLLIDVAMIVAGIVVAVLFFQKRRVAVRAIIGLMIASILANLVQVQLCQAMFEEVDPKPTIGACVRGAIWIPYFLKSKRVRNTFVN